MEKSEIVKELSKRGYPVKEENGIIMVIYDEDYEKTISIISKVIKELGFKGSFGVRAKKKGELQTNNSSDDQDFDMHIF